MEFDQMTAATIWQKDYKTQSNTEQMQKRDAEKWKDEEDTHIKELNKLL